MNRISPPSAGGTIVPDSGDRLRQAEMLLRIAGRVGRIGGWSVDLATQRVNWSDEVFAIHDIPLGEPPTLDEAIAFYPSEWRERLRELFDACARDGTPYHEEMEIETAAGRRIWVYVSGEAVRDAAGHVVAVQGAFQDIDSRKRGELALAEARQQSELILNSIAVGIQMVDADGRVQRQNPAACTMLGWQEEEVRGKQSELLDIRAPGEQESALRRTLRDGQARHVGDISFRRRDGTRFPVTCVCSPLRDAAGAVSGAVVSFRDVSAAQRGQALRASEAAIFELIAADASLPVVLERIVVAIEGLADGATGSVLLADPDGRHLRHGAAPNLPAAYNEAIDGRPIGPAAGSCGTSMHRGERVIVTGIETDPLWDDYRALARAHGLRACWSVPVKNSAGAVIATFALYYREPRSPKDGELELIGRFAHLVAIAIERTRTRESLRANEQRFHAVATAASDVVWDWNLRDDTVWWSEDFERVFARPTVDVATGAAWLSVIHPDDRDRVSRDVHDAIARRDRVWQGEYRFLRGDGGVVEIEDRGCLIFDDTGDPVRFVGGMTDITARQQAQRALRDRIKELRCLYQVLDLTSDYTRSVADICRDVARILPQSLPHDDIAVARVAVDGVENRSERWREPAAALRLPIAADNAAAGFVEIGYAEPRPDQPGGDGPFLAEDVAMVTAVAAHIGRMLASRQMAARLTQSERLGAVGELTGGVAHDFNNLLTVILGNAELLGEALADNPSLARLAEMTKSAAERGVDLTRHMLAFARRQPLSPRVTDVDALVAGMSTLLRRTLGEHVELVTMRDDGLGQALVDPTQLESALLNLCLNARDAMPDGGRLSIELRNVELDSSNAGWNDDVAPGAYVLIAVSDTGVGMTPDVAARAFEPFFTTKDTGRGSGLGLSMVYGFAKQSRGHVKIYSEVGQGTTVKLYLPRAAGDADRPAETVAGAVEGGRERILLVEDDGMVRDHVAAQLRALGYRVVSVGDGAAALRSLQNDGPFDLLFTDVVMPGMNGRQLADAARLLLPDLPVLFTSGYTENALHSQGRLDPGVHLLHKPYRRTELAAKLRQVIGRPR